MSALRAAAEAHAFHLDIAGAQHIVGPVLDPPGHDDIGRTSVRGIVLEPAVLRRVVRGGEDNAVGETLASLAIVDKDCPRHDRRRSHAVVLLDDGVHMIAGEDFERRAAAWASS